MSVIEKFKAYLREEKLPLTIQREQIVLTVLSLDDHFSAEDLADALKRRDVKVGMATIYRTLGLMVSSEVVREQDFGEGFKKYEKVIDGEPHGHLICEGCGVVYEFETLDIDRLQREVIDPHQFSVRSHKLEIYGLCRRCSRESRAGRLVGENNRSRSG